MDGEEKPQSAEKRPCIKCRKKFLPKDRTRHWYCDSCRKRIGKPTGPREVPGPVLPQDDKPSWFDDLI